jgi:hypothetical protein
LFRKNPFCLCLSKKHCVSLKLKTFTFPINTKRETKTENSCAQTLALGQTLALIVLYQIITKALTLADNFLCAPTWAPHHPLSLRQGKLLAQVVAKKRKLSFAFLCSHLGSNQGPSDYESDALTG